MNYHPHIHTILLGGGLTDKKHWKDKGNRFFLPIKIISKVFRGKYLEELKELWKENKLEFHGSAEKYKNHYQFKELLDICYKTEWVPHYKKTFNGAQSVIDYLGKYTHRIAVSNHRILRMDEKTVTFSVKDYKHEGKWKELTISGIERSCIVFGKGNKEREVYFDAKTKLHLEEYIQSRTDENTALFVGLRVPHEHMSIGSVEKCLKKIERKSGVSHIHPHKFRRTLATMAINKGMPSSRFSIFWGMFASIPPCIM